MVLVANKYLWDRNCLDVWSLPYFLVLHGTNQAGTLLFGETTVVRLDKSSESSLGTAVTVVAVQRL